jgi:hypothetical protein
MKAAMYQSEEWLSHNSAIHVYGTARSRDNCYCALPRCLASCKTFVLIFCKTYTRQLVGTTSSLSGIRSLKLCHMKEPFKGVISFTSHMTRANESSVVRFSIGIIHLARVTEEHLSPFSQCCK